MPLSQNEFFITQMRTDQSFGSYCLGKSNSLKSLIVFAMKEWKNFAQHLSGFLSLPVYPKGWFLHVAGNFLVHNGTASEVSNISDAGKFAHLNRDVQDVPITLFGTIRTLSFNGDTTFTIHKTSQISSLSSVHVALLYL